MSSQIDVSYRPVFPRGLIILLGLAAALVVALGMREFSNILGPVFMALVLSIAVHPIHRLAARFHLPAWLGMILSLIAVYAIVFGLFAILVIAGVQFASLLQELRPTIPGLLAAGQSSPPVSRCQPGAAPRLCERAQPKQTGWGCEQPARRARRRIERHLLPHRAAVLHSRRRGRLRLEAETRPGARSAARPGI